MIQQALRNFQYPFLTSIGLLLFLAVFIGVLLWTFRKNGPDFYRIMESLPLEDSPRSATHGDLKS